MNADEYEICTRRGHESSGFATTIGYETWEMCRHCGTEYRFGDPQLIEREVPAAFLVSEKEKETT